MPWHKVKRKSDVTKDLLEDLYLKRKLPSTKIAEKLKTSQFTIWNKLRKYKIKPRTMSEAKMKYIKSHFSGKLIEKSYILGLRVGDFSAKKDSKQITIITATTHTAQLEMFRKVFSKYSYIHSYISKINDGRKSWQIYCRLDNSFDFLLNKPNEIPQWILEDENYFYAFLAGYADCEACWNIWKLKDCKKARVRFQILSGDKSILNQIHEKLKEFGFKPKLRLAHKKGYRKTFGRYNQDMYCLSLNYQEELIRLAKILLIRSKHLEKIWKMKFILENKDRNWEEIKDKIEEFKNNVKESNLNNKSIKGLPYLPRDEKGEDEYLL